MTDNVMDLLAGRELDALVAERVMGWRWFSGLNQVDWTWNYELIDPDKFKDLMHNGGFQREEGKRGAPRGFRGPRYSTDPRDAMLVWERLPDERVLYDVAGWLGRFSLACGGKVFGDGSWDVGPAVQADGDTFCLVVCRAGLVAAEKGLLQIPDLTLTSPNPSLVGRLD